MCNHITQRRRRKEVRSLLEGLSIASALLVVLLLGFELGRLAPQRHSPTSPADGVTAARLESELARLERAIDRELTDQGEKWKTLAGRVDKRLGAPPRKPQDELQANAEASGSNPKLRAREKARRLGLASMHVLPSPESTESATRD